MCRAMFVEFVSYFVVCIRVLQLLYRMLGTSHNMFVSATMGRHNMSVPVAVSSLATKCWEEYFH